MRARPLARGPRLACPPRVFVSSVRATSSDTKTTLAVVTREVESLRVITGRAGEHVRAYLRSGAGACAIRREENAEARDFLRRLKQQKKVKKKSVSKGHAAVALCVIHETRGF